MLPPISIYKVGSGKLRWMEAATDVDRAKARVKVLAASSPGEFIIANQQTGEKISVNWPAKRIMFQIDGDEKALRARAELFRRLGHEVISVADNEAAKKGLNSTSDVDLFIVAPTACEQTRKEMVDWLKANFPKIKIVALNSSVIRPLLGADYNIVLNDWNEWLSLFAAVAN